MTLIDLRGMVWILKYLFFLTKHKLETHYQIENQQKDLARLLLFLMLSIFFICFKTWNFYDTVWEISQYVFQILICYLWLI